MLDYAHLGLYLLLAQFQFSRIACSAVWSVASVTSREIDCIYLNVIFQISVDELTYRSELDPNFRSKMSYLCRVSHLEFIEQWGVDLWWGTLPLSRPVLLFVQVMAKFLPRWQLCDSYCSYFMPGFGWHIVLLHVLCYFLAVPTPCPPE